MRRVVAALLTLQIAGLPTAAVVRAGEPAGAASHVDDASGRGFLIETDGDLRVWLLPSAGQDLQLFIQVANGGDKPLTLIPEQIKGQAHTVSGKKTKRVHLRAYTPAQYEDLVRRRQFIAGKLEARSVSMENLSHFDPAKSPDRAKDDYCRSGRAPSGECADSVTLAPVWETKLMGPVSAPPVLSAELLRKVVVPAYGARGGMVYMKLVPAEAYHITVPVAGKSFEFDFKLQKVDPGETSPAAPR